MAILEIQSLEKIYTARFGSNQVHALTDVSFSVEQGEYVAIMGESGSGKSTLLNILAALDKPTKGDVFLEGKPLSKIKEKEISTFRRDNLGSFFRISIYWILLLFRTIFSFRWFSPVKITGI